MEATRFHLVRHSGSRIGDAGERMRWVKRAGAGSLAAMAIAAFVYGLTLSPSVGAGDSGELILAAHTLGIPHPPGYPLWVLLGRFATLLPFGSVAFRVNAMCTVLGAIAAGLLYLLAGRCGLPWTARAAATAIFAASSIVWGSAVGAEVYSLASVAFLGLCLAALDARHSRGRSDRADAMLFFLAGLSPLVHQTLALPAVLLGAWALSRGFRISRALKAAGWAAAGFSIALFLPIRSSVHPLLDWGQDRNLSALWDNLLRRNYGGLRQNAYRLDRMWEEIRLMGAATVASSGLAAVALALAGAAFSRRMRAGLMPLTVAALTIPAALVLLVAFTPDPEHLAQIAPFLAPLAAIVALWAGAGVIVAIGRAPQAMRAWVAVACFAAILVTAAWHYPAADRGRFRLPERYGRDLLAALPHGATIVLDGDNETFLAAYLSRVEGYRTDLNFVNRRGYIFADLYGLRGLPRSRWPEIQRRVDLERLATSSGPVYYATPPGDLVSSGVRFVEEGLVYRALLPGSDAGRAAIAGPSAAVSRALAPSLAPAAAWPKSTELLPGGPERYDYVTRKLAITYSAVRAQALWDERRLEEAYGWYEDAARVGFDFPSARMNLAVAAAATGRPEVTLTELLAAEKLAPDDPEPSARLAVFFAIAGQYRESAIHFERAYRIAPDPDLAADAARAWSRAGEPNRARHWSAKG